MKCGTLKRPQLSSIRRADVRTIAHFYAGTWRGYVYKAGHLVCMSLGCLDFLHAKRVANELALQYLNDWSGL